MTNTVYWKMAEMRAEPAAELFGSEVVDEDVEDVEGEKLPGILSLSTKFLPTVMNLLKKLADEGQRPAAPEPRRNPELESRSFRNRMNGDSASEASSNVTSMEKRG